jgi:hypothetical protein
MEDNGTPVPLIAGTGVPASWVQISRLYMPDAKLEIELIAHLPLQQ